MEHHAPTGLPDDHSEWEPPESMPNSEVKPLSADGSVGLPHVRVGHRQASYTKARDLFRAFLCPIVTAFIIVY